MDREKYAADLRKVVLTQGEVLEEPASWRNQSPDYTANRHAITCGLVEGENPTIQEKYTFEGGDSFVEGKQIQVLRVGPVNCNCGELVNREVQYSGSFTDLLKYLFMVDTSYGF